MKWTAHGAAPPRTRCARGPALSSPNGDAAEVSHPADSRDRWQAPHLGTPAGHAPPPMLRPQRGGSPSASTVDDAATGSDDSGPESGDGIDRTSARIESEHRIVGPGNQCLLGVGPLQSVPSVAAAPPGSAPREAVTVHVELAIHHAGGSGDPQSANATPARNCWREGRVRSGPGRRTFANIRSMSQGNPPGPWPTRCPPVDQKS